MPIRPEMKALYQANWKQIRAEILARAHNRCEKCGRPNGTLVIVSPKGDWAVVYESCMPKEWRNEYGHWIAYPDGYYDNIDEPNPGYRMVKTILTISHQDHDPTNNDPSNLKALCQRCHLRHDAKEHASNARRTRAKKVGQCALKGIDE